MVDVLVLETSHLGNFLRLPLVVDYVFHTSQT